MSILRSILAACLLLLPSLSHAGNPERTGQAGATQLLINPYARSTGLNGFNPSFTKGVEAVATNVGGLANMNGTTEIAFVHTIWLGDAAGIDINTAGFAQKFNNGGVIGVNFTAFDFGEIEQTTIDNPDGGIGTFEPSLLNISLSYAKEMVPDRIFVGVTTKIFNENVANASTNGVAFDAGVQFHDASGKFKIGVALRNVGPEVNYQGDALAVRAPLGAANNNFDNAVNIEGETFELPGVLIIGASYDIFLGGTDSTEADHRITPTAAFYSQGFGNDQGGGGVEYGYKDLFAVRVSQLYEENIFNEDETRFTFTGFAAGASFFIPFGKDGDQRFGIDYSYRDTRFFNGTHSFGGRIQL